MSNEKKNDVRYGLEIVKQHLVKFVDPMANIAKYCAQHPDTQVEKDYQKIKASFDKLKVLLSESVAKSLDDSEQSHDFWTHMRHEMRAAMGGIKGYAELICDDILNPTDEFLQKELDVIVSLVDSLLAIVDQIQPSSKSEYVSLNQQNFGFHDNDIAAEKGNILIIDDSQEKHDLIKRRLVNTPYTIVSAFSGPMALKMLACEKPDLIILDLIMPEMNGFEVLNILKTNIDTRDIPVLIISSLNEIDSVVQCLQAGAEDYLSMPLHPTILITRVNSCIHKKNLRDREVKYIRELNESRLKLEKAIQSIDEGFAIFDFSETLMMCNANFESFYTAAKKLKGTAYTYEEFLRHNLGQGIYALEHCKESDVLLFIEGYEDQWIEKKLELFRQESSSHLEVLASGQWIEVITNRIPGGGTVCIHKDITARINHEHAIKYQADHDALTGLANRSYFIRELDETLKEARPSHPVSVMFFDLDGFKNINDTLGHEFGDHVLRVVAQKLSSALRSGDLVARLGGDEFCAVIKNSTDQDDLENLAKRCLDSIGSTLIRGDKQVTFGISIGISTYPTHGHTSKELIKKADEAMYQAKKSGKGRYIMAF